MRIKNKRILGIFLVLFFSFSLVAPRPAYARISFRKFFRSVRRATRFVVNVPYKATRFMGPTLGPIAGDLISVNLGKNPRFGAFFTKARKIDKLAGNIEEQNKVIRELRQIYQDQAAELDKKAAEIADIRQELAAELIKGNITREEHLERVADLVEISKIYKNTAERLRRSGDRLNPAHVIKILGSDFFKTSILKIKNLIEHETAKELNRLLDPEVIKNIISGSDSLEGVLQVLFSDDLNKLKENKDFDFDKFKDGLIEKIKKMLEEDKDTLKKNWREKMEELIQAEIEKTKMDKSASPSSDKSDQTVEGTDNGDCPSGYVFKPQTGVGCVQKNCLEGKIPNAHLSYTGQCICGSSGSINENPDDPNMECYYDNSHQPCPGCVYACVHLNEDCPEPPR